MKTKDSGSIAMRDVNQGVVEWLTGDDGICQWKASIRKDSQFQRCRRIDHGGRHVRCICSLLAPPRYLYITSTYGDTATWS